MITISNTLISVPEFMNLMNNTKNL